MDNISIPQKHLDNFISSLKVLSEEGRESTIYFSPNDSDIYKIYYDSIFKKPTKEKIKKLSERQKKISRTILPKGILSIYTNEGEQVLIGTIMKYFEDYVSIDELDEFQDIDMKNIFVSLVRSLKELTDNNIYPTDLNNKNILVNPNTLDLQIIDLDGEHCVVSDKEEPKMLKEIYSMLLYRIFSYKQEHSPQIDLSVRKYGYNSLSEFGYSDDLIQMLKGKESITYEKLLDVIDKLYPDKDKNALLSMQAITAHAISQGITTSELDRMDTFERNYSNKNFEMNEVTRDE